MLRFFMTLTVCWMFAAPLCFANEREFKLPESAKEILDNADEIEVFSLNPRPQDEGTFHGEIVLGKVTIKDKEEKRKVLHCVYEGIAKYKGTTVYRWDPRFGIRARQKEKTVDLVFCFEASQILVFRNPKAPVVQCDAFLFTARNAEAVFENILKKAKVPIAPKGD